MNRYKHYKNGKEYIVINYCKIQEEGEWVDAIIYSSVEGGLLFVRKEKEFEEKFKLIS